MGRCNTTNEYEHIDEAVIWKGMQFHHFGLILSALFGLIAILLSWYLIWRHCTHYLRPWEQRHIIRVLFLVPIYASVSFLSYYFYRHAVYFEVIRDCYEAFAIASFFSLLCHYIAPDLHSQKDYFRQLSPRPWVWPMSWLKSFKCLEWLWRVPRSGLTWFNIVWFGIFQYCFIRVFMTITAVITQAAGRYCLESLNPEFAHIWVMVIEGLCVSVAMYLLIQFYVQTKDDLHDHRPLLKVAAIKLVIFLSFWQTILISFLTSSGAIKSSSTIQTPDIKIGIPSMLLCIEMAIFAFFHLWAFPWQVYDVQRSALVASETAPGSEFDPKTAYKGGPLGSRALADAFNPWDIIKAVGRGFRWIVVGRQRRMEDISYKAHQRSASLEPPRDQFLPYKFEQYGRREGTGPYGNKTTPPRRPIREERPHTEDDSIQLLHHAQANPSSAGYSYPLPQIHLTPSQSSPYGSSSDLGMAHGFDQSDSPSNKYSHRDYSSSPSAPPLPVHYGVAATTSDKVPSISGNSTSPHSFNARPTQDVFHTNQEYSRTLPYPLKDSHAVRIPSREGEAMDEYDPMHNKF